MLNQALNQNTFSAGYQSFTLDLPPAPTVAQSPTAELLVWQLLARTVEAAYLYKPYAWPGVFVFFLALMAGYVLASMGAV